ncbi:hypothetical protein HanHA89_Chr12g0457741 [Helianthus annuus]|nr:hypothetical protein HanHA89_Chr12g0457741 [Helianthus annuus]
MMKITMGPLLLRQMEIIILYEYVLMQVLSGETESVKATWKLRTYLNLPWRPLISVDGTAVYDLDNQFRIVKYVESWSVSPVEAIGQIFTPNSGCSI